MLINILLHKNGRNYSRVSGECDISDQNIKIHFRIPERKLSHAFPSKQITICFHFHDNSGKFVHELRMKCAFWSYTNTSSNWSVKAFNLKRHFRSNNFYFLSKSEKRVVKNSTEVSFVRGLSHILYLLCKRQLFSLRHLKKHLLHL